MAEAIQPVGPPRTAVLTVVLRYVRERAARSEIGPLTAAKYRGDLVRFARHVGPDRPIARVTRRHVEGFLELPCGPATKRDRLSITRGFFAWAVKHHYRRSDPTTGMARIRQPRRLPRALAADQSRAAAAMTGDARIALCVSLGLQEGLRVAEMANLQHGDVDLTERTLRVKGKGGHERALPISDETMAALEAYLAEAPGRGGPLIKSRRHPHRGIKPATIGGYLADALRAAGVPATAHQLRHTMARDMLKAGSNLHDVQQALGHVNLGTTQIYLGFASVADLRKAMGGRRYRGPRLYREEER